MTNSEIIVRPGYAGGDAATANYDAVCTGETGHAEAIEIRFDPARIELGQILRIFFSIAHDPTQVDRQGADVGTQYRSAIFLANEAQRRIAEAYIEQIDRAGIFDAPVATTSSRSSASTRPSRITTVTLHGIPGNRTFERSRRPRWRSCARPTVTCSRTPMSAFDLTPPSAEERRHLEAGLSPEERHVFFFHIHATFESLDVEQMARLKEGD